jgi:hypothetical protein
LGPPSLRESSGLGAVADLSLSGGVLFEASSAVDAAHKQICLNLSWNFCFLQSIVGGTRNKNGGRRAMLVAFEINLALWLMIGFGIVEAVQLY